MSSFKGSFSHSVDEKGRINLPSKLRKYVAPENADTYVITRGFDKCLYIYPLDEWNMVEQKLRGLSNYNADDRLFLRTLLELANEVQLDGQARLSIPQELREYANILGDVKILGTLDKIEVWNPEEYEKYRRANPESYESIASKVMK
jgi:MraZ protein